MSKEGMIMPGDGNMGSEFSKIREGNIEDGTGIEIIFGEGGKDGLCVKSSVDKNGDPFVQIWVHDANDESAKTNIYCALHRPDGLAKLVDVICLSGVAIKMKKNGTMKKDPMEGIPETVLLDAKLHSQLNVSLPGCRVLATVKHVDSTYDGKPTINVNINRIASINTPQSPKVAKSVPDDNKKDLPTTSDEGW